MVIRRPTWAVSFVLGLIVCVLASSQAFAQDGDQPSFFSSVVKRVALDPTTYAPSIIAYDATMRDWDSSQPFFQNGLYVERNARFTVSGRPNDVAVDYATGKQLILKDAIGNFEMSLVNNVANALFEQME